MQKFDYRQFQKYFSPQAMKDLDRFLDNLPQNAGKMTLIAAGAIWAFTAIVLLFSVTEVNKLSQIVLEKNSAEVLKPNLPSIVERPVEQSILVEYLEKIKKDYPRLSFSSPNSGEIKVGAQTTATYNDFRRFVDHIQYGADSWRVDIKSLCVGRECRGEQIQGVLLVSDVRISQ